MREGSCPPACSFAGGSLVCVLCPAFGLVQQRTRFRSVQNAAGAYGCKVRSPSTGVLRRSACLHPDQVPVAARSLRERPQNCCMGGQEALCRADGRSRSRALRSRSRSRAEFVGLRGGRQGVPAELLAVCGGRQSAPAELLPVCVGGQGVSVELLPVCGGRRGASVEQLSVRGGGQGASVEQLSVRGGRQSAPAELLPVCGGRQGASVEL